ncbi:protein-export membrane protein SecF [Deltaproteobacteria bacterium]|nr:protein-export membrane protein SecF [Deltaproteobacteria bacterium]
MWEGASFFYAVSLVALTVGFSALSLGGGVRYGIDFAGGTIAQVKFAEPVDAERVKAALDGIGEQEIVVQRFGDDAASSYLIRVPAGENANTALRSNLTKALSEKIADNPAEIERLESVGPKVGADLRSQALEALYFATLLIAIYISGRFEQRWFISAFMAGGIAGGMYILTFIGLSKGVLVLVATIAMLLLCWRLKLIYALGAVVSIIHDVGITVGLFALLGKEFDLTTIAALLTIIGYSLNDTIIVYDRIRENLQAKKIGKLSEVINVSINQTLSRTILTSLTTLLVITALLFFGGSIIHDFAWVMFVGVLAGTYSSICIASPMLLLFGDTVVAQAEAARAEREEAARRERSRDRALT